MTSISQAVAWTLIHFCWQAAAIAVIYRVVSFALARRSTEVRYIAALSSLLLMLVLAVGTLAREIVSATPHISLVSDATNFAAPLAGDFPRTTAPSVITTQPEPAHISLQSLLPWIDGLWLAGVLVLSIRSFGGWWYLRRLRLSAITQAPSAVRASFDRICAALNLHRIVTLRLSAAIDSPMTMGALRAVVLLPLSAITSLGPEELEVVLAHELAHVRRADFFWNILQTIAETLFFFHPAVWWISARIRHERELCCDDLALAVCPNPVVYAHALFRLEQQRSHRLRLAMALDGHASHQNLLARILGEPMTRIPSPSFRPVSLAAAIAGLVVLLIPAPHVLAKLAPGQQSPAPVTTPIPVPATQNSSLSNSFARAGTAAPAPSSAAIQQALTASERSPEVAAEVARTVYSAEPRPKRQPSHTPITSTR